MQIKLFFFQLIYFTFIIYITWSPYNTVKRSKWNEANGRTWSFYIFTSRFGTHKCGFLLLVEKLISTESQRKNPLQEQTKPAQFVANGYSNVDGCDFSHHVNHCLQVLRLEKDKLHWQGQLLCRLLMKMYVFFERWNCVHVNEQKGGMLFRFSVWPSVQPNVSNSWTYVSEQLPTTISGRKGLPSM